MLKHGFLLKMTRTLSSTDCRGSVHQLRSAFNDFILCDEDQDGFLRFKGQVRKPVDVYVIGDVLFLLATKLMAFRIKKFDDGTLRVYKSMDNALYLSLGYFESSDISLAAFDRVVAKEWELFALRPAVLNSKDKIELIRCIDILNDDPFDQGAFSRASSRWRNAVMDALISLCTMEDEMRMIAKYQISDLDTQNVLKQRYPQDIYVDAVIGLSNPASCAPTSITLGEAWKNGIDGSFVSIPFSINCILRQKVKPSQKICVLATLRNEGPYILDWLAYHRVAGIRDFFVYFNDSDDGSKELLITLSRLGYVNIVENNLIEGGNAQNNAYTHALSFRSDILAFEWCAVIDLDEFIFLNDEIYSDITAFLQEFDGTSADAIAVNWTIYGPCQRLRRNSNEIIMESYPWRYPDAERHIKSIIRPQKFFTSSAHYPYTYRRKAYSYVDTLGRPHVPLDNELAWSAHPSDSRASIAHYAYKSLDEFLLKWSRNRGDNPRREYATNAVLTSDAVDAFVSAFPHNCRPTVAMQSRIARTRAELARLRSHPSVDACAIHIEEQYQNRISKVRNIFLDSQAVLNGHHGETFKSLIMQAGQMS